jgi:hypothetical protein
MPPTPPQPTSLIIPSFTLPLVREVLRPVAQAEARTW